MKEERTLNDVKNELCIVKEALDQNPKSIGLKLKYAYLKAEYNEMKNLSV